MKKTWKRDRTTPTKHKKGKEKEGKKESKTEKRKGRAPKKEKEEGKGITAAACSWKHLQPCRVHGKPRPACVPSSPPWESGKGVKQGKNVYTMLYCVNRLTGRRGWGTYLTGKSEKNLYIPYSSSPLSLVHILIPWKCAELDYVKNSQVLAMRKGLWYDQWRKSAYYIVTLTARKKLAQTTWQRVGPVL